MLLSTQLEVVGKNLLNICKLLFSVIREGSSDQLFIEEGIAGVRVLELSLMLHAPLLSCRASAEQAEPV